MELTGNDFNNGFRSVVGGSNVKAVRIETNEYRNALEPVFDSDTLIDWGLNFNDGVKVSIIDNDSAGATVNIEAYQSGATFINSAKAINSNYVLPAAELGLNYTLNVTRSVGDNNMVVQLDGSDAMRDGATTYTTAATLADVGDQITLTCLAAGEWSVSGNTGAVLS